MLKVTYTSSIFIFFASEHSYSFGFSTHPKILGAAQHALYLPPIEINSDDADNAPYWLIINHRSSIHECIYNYDREVFWGRDQCVQRTGPPLSLSNVLDAIGVVPSELYSSIELKSASR